MRSTGTLKAWNDERGFGFVEPANGDREVFIHISEFPRDGTRPTLGEKLAYEIGRGEQGRIQAVRVVRLSLASSRRRRKPARRGGSAGRRLRLLVSLLIVAGLVWYGYRHYTRHVSRAAVQEAGPGSPAETLVPATAPLPPTAVRTPPAVDVAYRCDGRTHCSQMTSCAEATFFLNNCPDAQMDGNGDGVPCERQWCGSPLPK